MSSSKGAVCRRFHELRKRLDRLKESWDSPIESPQTPQRKGFAEDWHERWSQIRLMLREIDQAAVLSKPAVAWDIKQPAILQFPPAEDGVVGMGSF